MTKGDWQLYQKCPRYPSDTNMSTLCCHCEDTPDTDPLNTRGRLALKAASLNTHVFLFRPTQPRYVLFPEAGGESGSTRTIATTFPDSEHPLHRVTLRTTGNISLFHTVYKSHGKTQTNNKCFQLTCVCGFASLCVS